MTPAGTPTVVVSCDTHVGPSLEGQLREYCPKQHLDDFDAFVAEQQAAMELTFGGSGEFDKEAVLQAHPNLTRPGHHDVHERLRDMDRDGVAAEVIFHFSQNGEPLPFMPDFTGGLSSVRAEDFEAPRSASGSTTAGSPTSCPSSPSVTSGSRTCRRGTSTRRPQRSSGRARPGCVASTSRRRAVRVT